MISVVDSNSCAKLAGISLPFLLVLKRGESVIESILKCATAAKIDGAALMGLGALENPTIAYYNLETKQYENKTYPGIFELISLNGNLARTEGGEVVLHSHVSLGDENHNVIGGHLTKAIVGVTAEITIIPFKGSVTRKLDPAIGLKLISTN